MGLGNFFLRAMGHFIRGGGTPASEEHAKARLEICKKCPKAGMVEPKPLLKTEGCTVCGCPFITKPRMLSMKRRPDKVGQPLDEKEIYEIAIGKETVIEEIKCPHPEGDKWAEIDRKFKNKL